MAEAVEAPTDPESFLAWEFEQEERYERLNGIVRMMVGGTNAHHIVCGNLFGELWQRLRGSGCRPFAEAARLVTPDNDVLYPDVVVSCDRLRQEATALTDATLVAEVLSASTEGRDRGAKWHGYRVPPGLRHYLLLAQDRPYVEAFHWRGQWVFEALEGPDAILRLETWDMVLPVGALYADLPEGPDGEPE